MSDQPTATAEERNFAERIVQQYWLAGRTPDQEPKYQRAVEDMAQRIRSFVGGRIRAAEAAARAEGRREMKTRCLVLLKESEVDAGSRAEGVDSIEMTHWLRVESILRNLATAIRALDGEEAG